MVRAVGRVGLQRRWYRYDGLPHEKPAPEGIHRTNDKRLIVDSFGPGTVLAIGAIVGGLVTLNWYQSRELVKPSLQRSYPRTSDVRLPFKYWNLTLGSNIRSNTTSATRSTRRVSDSRILSRSVPLTIVICSISERSVQSSSCGTILHGGNELPCSNSSTLISAQN